MYEVLIIIVFLIIIFFIYLTISNDMNKPMMVVNNYDYINHNKPFHNSSDPNEIAYPNKGYVLKINEEEVKRSNHGYENELMYKNNLKEGEYIHYFQQEINDVPTDNQIGFDIQPRERPYKLPYSNVHIKCL